MPIQESPNVVIHDPQRAHHLLMLEFGDRKDFDDPRLEYRRLCSELLGTFMLVLVAAGGGILHAKGQISLAAAVVAPGLMVLAIILFMGAVSGARAVFAADKIAKVRELALVRALQLNEPKNRAKLAHYRESLEMLRRAAGELALVDLLDAELKRLTPTVTTRRRVRARKTSGRTTREHQSIAT